MFISLINYKTIQLEIQIPLNIQHQKIQIVILRTYKVQIKNHYKQNIDYVKDMNKKYHVITSHTFFSMNIDKWNKVY